MIKIWAGGKKNPWVMEMVAEYQKRCLKPYDQEWEFFDEEKLLKKLNPWPFTGREFVIVCDERGKMMSSPEFSSALEKAFVGGKNVVILIGGAYGFSEEIRAKADLIWSFSKLVFPHRIADVIVSEQIYRAEQIAKGTPYHHE